MSAMQIKITSTEFMDPDFAWYELFGSTTNWSLANVEAHAEFNCIADSNLIMRGGLVSGAIWYHWIRAVYADGTVKSDLTALGAKTAVYVDTADIAASAVTYAKMQNVSATSRLLGRKTAGAGVVEELTGTQATTLLDAFSSALKGLAPASGGGSTNFLRADGNWAPPPSGGGQVLSHATMSTDIVVSSTGYTTFNNWNTTQANVGGAQGTTYFTAPTTGWYRVTLGVGFDTIGSGELQITITNNSVGGFIVYHDQNSDFGGAVGMITSSILVKATAGDLLYATIYSGSVSSYSLKSGFGAFGCFWSIEWMGP